MKETISIIISYEGSKRHTIPCKETIKINLLKLVPYVILKDVILELLLFVEKAT